MISLSCLRPASTRSLHVSDEQWDYRLFRANETVYISKAILHNEGGFGTRVYNTRAKHTTSFPHRLVGVASTEGSTDALVVFDEGEDDLTYTLALVDFESNTTHWMIELPDDSGFRVETVRIVLGSTFLGYSFDYGDYDAEEPFPNDHRLMHFRSYTREGMGAGLDHPVMGTIVGDSLYYDHDSWWQQRVGEKRVALCTMNPSIVINVRNWQEQDEPLNIVAWSMHSWFFVLRNHLFRVQSDGHVPCLSKNVVSIERCGSAMMVRTQRAAQKQNRTRQYTFFFNPHIMRKIGVFRGSLEHVVQQPNGTFKALTVTDSLAGVKHRHIQSMDPHRLWYKQTLIRQSPVSIELEHLGMDPHIPLDLIYPVAKYLIPMTAMVAVNARQLVFNTELMCGARVESEAGEEEEEEEESEA